MRLRIPPLLPTYLLLVLVVLFAVGSLWVGLDRIDAIERLGDSRARASASVQDLQALQNTVTDIATSAQSYARSGDQASLDLFERARRSVPSLLSSLRDRLRDDPAALALVERLVPLLARSAALAAAAMERRNEAPGLPLAPDTAADERDAVEAIRSVIANLEARERDKLALDGRELTTAIAAARVMRYLLAALIVLLAGLLFMAVHRLNAFMMPTVRGSSRAVDLQSDPLEPSNEARIAMLLQDALARARLGAATQDAAAGARLEASAVATEGALREHARADASLEQARPGSRSAVDALALLARTYTQPGGLTVNATLDQAVEVRRPDTALVIDRVAEWGLEAIAMRKRDGEVTLQFGANGRDASLRILALLDHPDRPLRLTPRQREDADFLQRVTAALGGRFVVNHGPTGFGLVLTVPLDA